MRITRVDSETVRCLITADDLSEQGIQLQDFFEHKQEAMDFLKGVLQQAIEEVDYHPTGAYMPMQITVLPDQSLSLTLSENSEEAFADLLRMLTDQMGLKLPNQLLTELGEVEEGERIKKIGEFLQSLKNFTSSMRDLIGQDGEENGESAQETEQPGLPQLDLRAENQLHFSSYIFSFRQMRNVIDCCRQIPSDVVLGSALYKDTSKNVYYLLVRRMETPARTFAAIFTLLYEYGSFMTTDEKMISSMSESQECLMAEHAIEQLRGL